MKLIVGLGNPGDKYANTRHNTGFMFLDVLASKLASEKWLVDRRSHNTLCIKHNTLILAKPQTFMNSSGTAVQKLVKYYKIKTSELWVVHDDLDINLGHYKIQFGVGPKLHNGIESVENYLKTKDFWRLRIGVDNRGPEKKISGEDYVLQNFSTDEKVNLTKILERSINDLLDKITE